MRRRKDNSSLRRLGIALVLSMAMLLAGTLFFESVQWDTVFRRMLFPLVRLLAFITLGLAVGQMIEATGWTGKIGKLGAPLFRFARLGPQCSAAFSTAFFSGTAANAMLYEFWQDGKISRQQLILTNLANQLPAFFLHLPTTVFIVLPLTGWAGGLYFILTFLAALIRLAAVLLWGRFRQIFDSQAWSQENSAPLSKDKRRGILKAIGEKLPGRLTTVATYVVPIYIAVFLLNSAGVFDWTRQWLAHWVSDRFVPVEALSLVVLSFAAEFTSGFAAAGAMLQEGVITSKQAVMALLVGNVVAFPIRALRHQLPRLMGIFAPRLGLQILLLGQGFRIVSLILVGGAYYFLF
ncbi:hypothetical protein DSCW_33970 [Desulfosarcina widdelii]|uniref:Nucleoside recognition protein n=1 Tax=Desulfosarcina widdelii TaxID=947919 RepID=A0A5K7Z5H8_9BACT|nr:nucleoside recognition protein [Desulfosarcina widdelii]BBO75980.1 hypothetical protein DSCW_33970 [Desulfosarcina widdelii]